MAGASRGVLGGDFVFNAGDNAGVSEKGPLLPLRVVVVADLVPRDPHNAGASPPAGALRVDPSRFDALFAALRPRLAIEVPSVLSAGKAARVDLSPGSLKSFRPDGLCAEIPLLRSLLDGRLALDRLRDGSITVDHARDELDRLWGGSPLVREILGLLPAARGGATPVSRAAAAAPAPPATAPAETDVDALLALVDLGGGDPGAAAAPPGNAESDPGPGPAPVATRFSDFLSGVVASARPRAGQPVQPTEALAQLERVIGAQIGAILQHPEVRRLEEAWRGLSLLADRTRGVPGARLEVVSARPDEAAAALARVLQQTAGSDPPASAAIVDAVTVDGSAAALTRLEELARVAEAHTLPTLVNGTAKLLGEGDLRGVERLDNKAALFQAPHRAPWRSAAARPCMRWVAIAMNRTLARPPYDKASSRIREATIVEQPNDAGSYVWISPAYLVGALVVTSFRETEWPCRITGARSGGVLGDLPVHETSSGSEGEEARAIPTEAFISTDTQRELAKSGILMLASAPNSDAIYVLSAPTAYVPTEKRTYDSATSEPEDRLERVSLGDQLFVARVVQFLRAFCGKLPPDSDPAEVQPVVEGALWALFEGAPPASIEVAVKASHDKGGTSVAVSIRPRRFLGVVLDEVSLEMPLG